MHPSFTKAGIPIFKGHKRNQMKYFLTASALLFSLVVAAQFPNLPYNPDENSDGLIGVVDLQGLLANYGSEFASAVLSEDGESAIVSMGNKKYPLCAQACESLPGNWLMPTMEDLGLAWGEVYSTSSTTETWLKREPGQNSPYSFTSNPGTNPTSHTINSGYLSENNQCFCVAKQLPRTEYDVCYGYDQGSGTSGVIQAFAELSECVNAKLEQGWQLYGSQSWGPQYNKVSQSLWRWAE